MEKIVFPKLVASGIFNSQVALKGIKISKNREVTMFEIELPVKNGGWSFIDNNSAPVSTDMIICGKPGQIRHTRLPYMCYYVHLVVNDGILYDILSKAPNFIKTKNRQHYADLLKKVDEYSQSGTAADEIMVQSCLLNLIYSINRETINQTQKINSKSTNRLTIEKSLVFIEENLSADLTLKTVSDSVSLSPVYFHNIFKLSTGVTLHEYVEQRRIKKAINLLVSTKMTLTEIAYECGFSSQSYFSYAFKRRMNMTPREYVKKVYKKYSI